MSGILIADAGSSKTNWSLITPATDNALHFSSPGINPFHDSSDTIQAHFSELKRELSSYQPVSQIFFYGAGCASLEVNQKIENLLSQLFPKTVIKVESDLKGAARALFGNGSGIPCILGTGSNSCLFIDGEIVGQTPSLGFILGDEGGGVNLGKNLLNAVFKNLLNDSLSQKFLDEYQISIPELLKKVYQTPKPAPFLASFTPFLLKNICNPEIKDIVYSQFHDFFTHNISPYKKLKDYKAGLKLGFIGSVAFHFRETLCECAQDLNFTISEILADPMEKLISYHAEK